MDRDEKLEELEEHYKRGKRLHLEEMKNFGARAEVELKALRRQKIIGGYLLKFQVALLLAWFLHIFFGS